jgi:hypothetical protein
LFTFHNCFEPEGPKVTSLSGALIPREARTPFARFARYMTHFLREFSRYLTQFQREFRV